MTPEEVESLHRGRFSFEDARNEAAAAASAGPAPEPAPEPEVKPEPVRPPAPKAPGG